MTLNDDDLFEEALRTDLPSFEQQERSRKRLMAVGLSVGSGIAATGAATTAQASWGATVIAKIAALSWPATVALTAAVATPLVALPLWLAPENKPHAAAPVRASANRVAAQAVAATPLAIEPSGASAVASAAPVVEPRTLGGSNAPVLPHVPEPSPASVATQPAVAAFDPVGGTDAARAPAASTLAAETQLLDRAFVELGAGNRAAAATLIAEHARRFPNGLLRQERERAQARLVRDSE